MINIGKIKAHTPNLKVVNLYGIGFVDDTHIDLLSANCIHLECLALNFCLKVKGASFKQLLQKCRKLKTLLLQHCGEEDDDDDGGGDDSYGGGYGDDGEGDYDHDVNNVGRVDVGDDDDSIFA